MSVYKPKNSPYWHFDFQFRGRRFFGSTGCTSKRAADQFEARERRRAALGDDAKEPITIDQACGLWWAHKGGFDMKNAATYETQINTLKRSLGANRVLGDISIRDFDRHVAKRRAHVKPATVNREIELARRIWRHADSRNYDVPAITWGELLLEEPKERVRELSQDEERRLFEALPDHLKPIVEFALMSGQRRTEVIRLRWADVDFQGRRAFVDAKGPDGNRHSFPLTQAMVVLLANQPKAGPFVFTYVCRHHSPARGDRARRIKGVRYPFSKQGWARDWRVALKAAGIEDFRFHDLRHTAGTRGMRETGNLKVVGKMLNHKDVKTTARYVHALESDVRAMMDAVESRNSPEQRNADMTETRRNSKER